MSDDDQAPTPEPSTDDFLQRLNAFEQQSKLLRPQNKTVIFNALAAAGISSVKVHFDGYGDSGQIEDIEAFSEDSKAFPSGTVEIGRLYFGNADIEQSSLSIQCAVEALAYDCLEQSHGGWENNEGAYGDFIFNVADRSITLDYNERFESSEYTQHVF